MYLFKISTDITQLKKIVYRRWQASNKKSCIYKYSDNNNKNWSVIFYIPADPCFKKDPQIHFWEHQEMCLKTSLCRTKVELMSNQFRVTKPEDAFGTTALEGVEGNQLHVNSLDMNDQFWYSEGSVQCTNLQSTQSRSTLQNIHAPSRGKSVQWIHVWDCLAL